jgi:glycosyltransferase involved in cell wall biosynthesis
MKKKILLSAFACRPSSGSEWGVGWNFFIRLVQYYDVHLITEGEFKEEIKDACQALGISLNNIHFIDLSKKARARCHNQGDWRFYFDYRIWQKRAMRYAKELHQVERFSLVHHLNMIGFREPGDMWKLSIPFILGPLGGFGDMPDEFFQDHCSYQRFKNIVKRFLNNQSMRLRHVVRAISSAKFVLAAYPEGMNTLRHKFSKEAILLPETGCSDIFQGFEQRKNVIWIGKNVPRKQFDLAAKAFLKSELSLSENLIVVGQFSKNEMEKWKPYPNVVFRGQLKRHDVLIELSQSRALLFTSVHEGNPHVVYEAISTHTPVLCHDCFGMGHLINDAVGIKVAMKNPEYSLQQFTNALNELRNLTFSPEAFAKLHDCNSWQARIVQLCEIYERCLKNEK